MDNMYVYAVYTLIYIIYRIYILESHNPMFFFWNVLVKKRSSHLFCYCDVLVEPCFRTLLGFLCFAPVFQQIILAPKKHGHGKETHARTENTQGGPGRAQRW